MSRPRPDDDFAMKNMDVHSREKNDMIALSCPSCGAPIRFGMGACGHCGSGLMKKVGDAIKKFTIPNEAHEMKVGVDFTDRMDLKSIVQVMQQKAGKDGYAYVMWRDVPVLVGSGIDGDEALRNFTTSMRQKERDQLGGKWTRAVQQFGGFLKQLEGMDYEQREAVGDKYFDSWGEDRRLPSRSFFTEPSFSNMEELMACMATRDDAEALSRVVSDISEFVG